MGRTTMDVAQVSDILRATQSTATSPGQVPLRDALMNASCTGLSIGFLDPRIWTFEPEQRRPIPRYHDQVVSRKRERAYLKEG